MGCDWRVGNSGTYFVDGVRYEVRTDVVPVICFMRSHPLIWAWDSGCSRLGLRWVRFHYWCRLGWLYEDGVPKSTEVNGRGMVAALNAVCALDVRGVDIHEATRDVVTACFVSGA